MMVAPSAGLAKLPSLVSEKACKNDKIWYLVVISDKRLSWVWARSGGQLDRAARDVPRSSLTALC